MLPNLSRKSRPGETVIRGILMGSALLSVAITVGIVVALIRPVIDFFREVPFGDFFATEGRVRRPAADRGHGDDHGHRPARGGAARASGAAMYLSEYASRRARKVLKPTVELLAGVPSVVYGFFALTFVTPTLLQDILSLEVSFTNALAAGLVLGVMIIPTVASLSEDAMSAVPQALRQGSLAMGANRMQTTLRVVLPAALSGVAAAIVLGMSRAVGETMIVALAVRRPEEPRRWTRARACRR